MKKEIILYAITNEDVKNVSDEMNISASTKDLPFVRDKIGHFFGSQWHDAIEYALIELKSAKENK